MTRMRFKKKRKQILNIGLEPATSKFLPFDVRVLEVLLARVGIRTGALATAALAGLDGVDNDEDQKQDGQDAADDDGDQRLLGDVLC